MKLVLAVLFVSFTTPQANEGSHCKENETFSTCPSRCGDGCNLLALEIECTPNVCSPVARCTCNPGFYRCPIRRKCVPSCECPKKEKWNYFSCWQMDTRCYRCDVNEEIKESNRCTESCDAAVRLCLPTPEDDRPACYCKENYCRNSVGFCVPKLDWRPPNFPDTTCPKPNCTADLELIYVPYDPVKGYPVVVLYPNGQPPSKHFVLEGAKASV